MLAGSLCKTGRFQDANGTPTVNFTTGPFGFFGRPWAVQGPILDPRGVPKMFQNRHGEARSAPWGAKKGQKALPKWVPKWGRKSERKGLPK